jgi:hypothetical protein
VREEELRKLSSLEQADALELTYAYLMYERALGRRDGNDDDLLAYKILSLRSALSVASRIADPPRPSHRPEEGHNTGRLALGVATHGDETSWTMGWRPAYHDLMDPEKGYLRGAQIQFFDVTMSQSGDDKLRVEQFVPLDILSLADRSDFLRPTSWSVRAEMRRRMFKAGERDYVGKVAIGFGRSYELFARARVFALFEPTLEYSGNYRDHFILGPGVRSGGFLDVGSYARLMVEGTVHPFYLGSSFVMSSLSSELSVPVARNWALLMRYTRGVENMRYYSQSGVSINWYW